MLQQLLYFIYALTDPRFSGPSAVRYIGVTDNPNARYTAHLNRPQFDPEQKNAWIEEVLASGLEPSIEILEVHMASKTDRVKAEARETYWIQHYTQLGARLLNVQKNKISDQKAVIVDLPSEKYVENPFPEGNEIRHPNGIIIREISFADFFELFLARGAIGTSD